MNAEKIVTIGILALFLIGPMLAACIARNYARSEVKRRAMWVTFFWMALPNYAIIGAILLAKFSSHSYID